MGEVVVAGSAFVVLASCAVYSLLAGPSNGTAQNRPYRIAVDKARAYWTNEGNLSKNDGTIAICDLNAPLPGPLATSQDVPRNLVLDIDESTSLATAVYWANYGTSGSEVSQKVMMVSLADPTNARGIATGNQPSGIALDKDAVQWTNQGDNTVMKLNKADGSTHVVAQKQNMPGAITVDKTHIYWITEGDTSTPGSIMRISKTTPEPK